LFKRYFQQETLIVKIYLCYMIFKKELEIKKRRVTDTKVKPAACLTLNLKKSGDGVKVNYRSRETMGKTTEMNCFLTAQVCLSHYYYFDIFKDIMG